MPVIAKLKHLRVAPRKVRLVADLIRGKRTDAAQNILNFTTNKSSTVILKLLRQAIANAKNNFKLSENNLYISKITVDGGPMLKRFRPRARGSAYEIQKKTSHVTIILDEDQKLGVSEKEEEKISAKTDGVSSVFEGEVQDGEKLKKQTSGRFTEAERKKDSRPKIEGAKQKIFRRKTF